MKVIYQFYPMHFFKITLNSGMKQLFSYNDSDINWGTILYTYWKVFIKSIKSFMTLTQ